MRNQPAGLSLLLAVSVMASPAVGAESVEMARIDAAAWSYVVFAASVTLVKVVALVIGYLVVRLGYTTMMAGVQGKDSVELKLPGARFAFKGVTPGLALGVVGVLMMIWALSTKHQFTVEASSASIRTDLREGTVQSQGTAKPGADKSPAGKAAVKKAPEF